jgi:hypothetical protein
MRVPLVETGVVLPALQSASRIPWAALDVSAGGGRDAPRLKIFRISMPMLGASGVPIYLSPRQSKTCRCVGAILHNRGRGAPGPRPAPDVLDLVRRLAPTAPVPSVHTMAE